MVIEEMTESDCRVLLAAGDLARLACAHDNQPYVVPLHVYLDGQFLYAYSMLGQHVEWMRLNPLVCLEADAVAGHANWASVVVLGRYEELTDTAENEELRAVAERLFQTRPMWWEPASVPLAGHDPQPRIVFRIRISRITGRRATAAGR